MRDVNQDKYTLRFYKADDALEIYKVVDTNSGIMGGKIVKRFK